MKSLDTDKLSTRLLTIGLCSIVLFLPWRIHIANISIVVTASLWFLLIPFNKHHFTKQNILFIVLFCSLYLIEVLGMIHTENIEYGLHRLESKSSLVAFPLILLASGLNRDNLRTILNVFITSVTAACTWCVISALLAIQEKGQPFSAFLTDPAYSNVRLTVVINELHPTYLTLFICVALFLLIPRIKRNITGILLLLLVVYLVFFAFQLASRAGMIALFLTLVISGAYLLRKKSKLVLAIYFTVVITAQVITIFSVPTIKNRMIDTVVEASLEKEQFNSVSFHYKSWYCSVEKWLDNHILFGYGSGDETRTLEECYNDKGWTSYRHDAHNEYLSSLVKHGVVGLVILLACLLYPLYLALRARHLLYIMFLVTVGVCFLSESMLRGQTGVVYYALFNALIMKDLLLSKNLSDTRIL